MKDVLISVIGLQHSYEGDEDSDTAIEVVTEGTYHIDESGSGWFRYNEGPLTDLGDTVTTFYFDREKAKMVRTGAVHSEMKFNPAAPSSFIYGTEFGGIPMNIATSSVINRLDEHGGDLTLNYSLSMNSVPIGENRFSVSIRELKP